MGTLMTVNEVPVYLGQLRRLMRKGPHMLSRVTHSTWG